MHRHLRAGVQLHFRQQLFGEMKHAQILNYQRVNFGLSQRAEDFRQFAYLGLGKYGIQCDKDLASERVGIGGQFVQFLRGKILRSRAGGKAGQSEIDRVRAVMQGGVTGLKPAGGRQQFVFHFGFLFCLSAV